MTINHFSRGAIDNRLFRRQFILAPSFKRSPSHWRRMQLGPTLCLAAHPDLNVSHVTFADKAITLIGFILDPFRPILSDTEVITEALFQCKNLQELLTALETKGGRYVLISKFESSWVLLTDPAGFRQVFYHNSKSAGLWCASQPERIADQLNFRPDADVLTDLGHLPLFRNSSDYWFPGNITPYRDIYHLTPNNLLDLKTGEVRRYWPTKPLTCVTIESCLASASSLLEGLLQSACARFHSSLAITCGLDTRIILAAARLIRDKVYYFTHTHRRLDMRGPDITIPAHILATAGLTHNVVHLQKRLEETFESLFRQNVSFARTHTGLIAFSMDCQFNNLGKEFLVINGNCGEITRCFYRLPRFVRPSGGLLAKMALMNGSRTARHSFAKWMDYVGPALNHNVDIMDLFYWENRNARWAAASYSEYDISFESFSPFNCRRLLVDMLSVDEKYRMPPKHSLHHELIGRMWPDLLNYPINPPLSIRERVVSSIRGTYLYRILRTVKLCFPLLRA